MSKATFTKKKKEKNRQFKLWVSSFIKMYSNYEYSIGLRIKILV